MKWDFSKAILLLLSACALLWGEKKELIDKVVAKVDGEVITLSDLNEVFNLYRSQISPQEMSDEELRKQVLDELINKKLLYLEAKSDTTIQVTDEEVNQALEQQLQDIEATLGKERFEEELRAQGLTRDDLKKQYAELVRENLYVSKYVDKYVRPKIKVTPKEIKEFYEEKKDSIPERPEMVRLSHVLIMITASPEKVKEAEERAWALYRKIKKENNFETFARQYSDDRESADLGGDIGYVDKSALQGEMRDKVFALEPGDISEPLRSVLGFHIFKCEEKRGNTMHLRHILIAVKPTHEDTVRALEKADKVMKEFRSGVSFEKLVEKYSDDTATKDLGGDLGWVPLQSLPIEVQNAVKEMKVGDVRGPLLAGVGFHIIKLTDRKGGGKPSFEEVSADIQQILYQRKLEEELNKVLERLKKKFYIEKRL